MSSTKPTNQSRLSPSYRPHAPKRILQTIYGSRFIRNSKQLVPLLNTSAHNIKSGAGRNSSDYYTFQRGLGAGETTTVKNGMGGNQNNNPEMRRIQHDRKAYTVAKPSSSYKQSLTMATSRTKLINFGSVTHQNINTNTYTNTNTNVNNSNISNANTTNVNMATNSPNPNISTLTNIASLSTPKSNPKSTRVIISMNTTTTTNNNNINNTNNNNKGKVQGYSSGRKIQAVMNNTSTGFTISRNPPYNQTSRLSPTPFNSNLKPIISNTSTNPTSPKIHPSSKTNIMSNTAYSFRPTTNGNLRQCNNNQAENLNNYLSKYEIVKELGKGTYGVVHLAKKKKQREMQIEIGIGLSKDIDGDIKCLADEQIDRNEDSNDSFLITYKNIKQNQQQKQKHQQSRIKNQSFIIEDSKNYECSNQKSIDVQFQRSKLVQQQQEQCPKAEEEPKNKQQQQQQNSQFQKLGSLTQQNIKLQGKQQFSGGNTYENCRKQIILPKKQKQQNIQDQQQQLFAIKIYQKFKMNKDPTKFKNIRKQINIMQNIHHDHIIRLYQSVQTLTKISLVVEYGGNQSLLDFLKQNYPLEQKVMRRIGLQLLDAIKYLHDKNIVHRDIKLQNILMGREGKIKIIDFGFSTLTFRNRKLNAICGTPNYMAPQVLSKKQYIGQYADIWSFGVVMFTIAEGRHPFKAETYNELQRLANKGSFNFKRINNTVHQAFIKRILRVKAEDRPRAADLMTHPWLAMKDQEQNRNQYKLVR